jgi:hypothetical protein
MNSKIPGLKIAVNMGTGEQGFLVGRMQEVIWFFTATTKKSLVLKLFLIFRLCYPRSIKREFRPKLKKIVSTAT